LLGFKAGINFIDHINPAFTAHDLTRGVACFQGFDRALDFHGRIPKAAQCWAHTSFLKRSAQLLGQGAQVNSKSQILRRFVDRGMVLAAPSQACHWTAPAIGMTIIA
jgi:hypothetical protein